MSFVYEALFDIMIDYGPIFDKRELVFDNPK